jgi:ABC-type Fe3+-hydroxamate transport system substrate-binding protein
MDEEENRREDYEFLVNRGIAVHVLRVRSLLDVNPSMSALADRVGAYWSPTVLPAPTPERARAFIPIWRRPWIALGTPNYGASLLAHLGISTVFDAEGPYPTVELDDAIAHHPDVVLAPSEPYPFTTRQRFELEKVAPTVFVDGKDVFWWGARTPGAIARLAEIFTVL